MADKIFIKGMIYKAPREGAPSFIKGSLSFKVEEFTDFMAEHAKNGWINVDLKESKGGKLYAELNSWERPTTEREDRESDRRADEGDGSEEDRGENIPF